MTTLALFTIIGGIELIGKVDPDARDGNGTLTLSHPLVVRPIQKAPGQYALDLFPHSLTNPEGEHTFYVSSFISQSKQIPDMLRDAYLERTSSIILSTALDAMERMK